MARDFGLEIRTPSEEVLKARVNEVLLSAYDGEVGILPGHGDFIGLLGAGVCKIIINTKETWLFIDSGIYQFTSDTLNIYANRVEQSKDLDAVKLENQIKDYQSEFGDIAKINPNTYEQQIIDYKKDLARLKVCKMETSLLVDKK